MQAPSITSSMGLLDLAVARERPRLDRAEAHYGPDRTVGAGSSRPGEAGDGLGHPLVGGRQRHPDVLVVTVEDTGRHEDTQSG